MCIFFLHAIEEQSIKNLEIAENISNLYNEMKEKLQPYVQAPISVLETGSIIQTHTGENAWAILVHYE